MPVLYIGVLISKSAAKLTLKKCFMLSQLFNFSQNSITFPIDLSNNDNNTIRTLHNSIGLNNIIFLSPNALVPSHSIPVPFLTGQYPAHPVLSANNSAVSYYYRAYE